jgi:U6 snRNA-associated Sm-like protein LSm6
MSASPINNGAAAAAAPTSVNEARDPSGFLSEIIGAPVTVKLNSGVVYRGVFPLLATRLRRKNQR